MPRCRAVCRSRAHLCAVLAVGRVQRVQKQYVADVQHVHVQPIPVDVRLAEIGVGPATLVERALLAHFVGHHQRVGSRALPPDLLEGDVGPLAQLFQHEIAGLVFAHAAQRRQRQLGIERGQIEYVVAEAAAGGARRVGGDSGQFAGLGKAVDGIEHIHDHVSRHSDALFCA